MESEQYHAEPRGALTAWGAWFEVLVESAVELAAEDPTLSDLSTEALEELATRLAARGWPPGWIAD